jgi:hypothetical protein
MYVRGRHCTLESFEYDSKSEFLDITIVDRKPTPDGHLWRETICYRAHPEDYEDLKNHANPEEYIERNNKRWKLFMLIGSWIETEELRERLRPQRERKAKQKAIISAQKKIECDKAWAEFYEERERNKQT